MLKQQILDLLIPAQQHLEIKPRQTFDWADPETDPNYPEFRAWCETYWSIKGDLEEFLVDHGYVGSKYDAPWVFWTEDYVDELIAQGVLR